MRLAPQVRDPEERRPASSGAQDRAAVRGAQVGGPCPTQLKRPADLIGKQSSTGPPCCLHQKLLHGLSISSDTHQTPLSPAASCCPLARLLQQAGPCHRARCTLSLGSLQTLGPLACPLKAEQTDFRVWKVLVFRKRSWCLRWEEMALRRPHTLPALGPDGCHLHLS